MPDTLRAQIAQRCIGHLSAADVRRILALAMPLVEQAIQQEREKAEYFLRLAAEQHERDAAALAEKDAQIAALRTLLNYALNGWGAHARKDMEHEEIGRLRNEAARLRETPAPPQEPTKFRTAEARKGDR